MLLRRQQVLDCSFSSWYPHFRHVSPRSVVIDLPPDFVQYLVQDNIVVPPGSRAFCRRGERDVEYADSDDYQDWSDEDEGDDQGEDQQRHGLTRQRQQRRQEGSAQGGSEGADGNYDGGSDDENEAGDEDDEGRCALPASYSSVVAAIEAGVSALGGRVVPKLNWSCPKDATWVNPLSSLACTNADEVVLMLKSSDRIAHDVCHAFAACLGQEDEQQQQQAEVVRRPAEVAEAVAQPATVAVEQPPATSSAGGDGGGDGEGVEGSGEGGQGSSTGVVGVQYCLALRRWYELRPEREFRAFVKSHELVGVCQRHITEFFPQLQGQQLREQLRAAIEDFHEHHVAGRFPGGGDYTYDLYVASSSSSSSSSGGGSHPPVRLLDFNPVGGTTAPLLFEWAELGYGVEIDETVPGVGSPGSGAPRPSSSSSSSGGGGCGGPSGGGVGNGHVEENGVGDTNGGVDDDNDSGDDEDGDDGEWELRLIDGPVGIRPDKAAYMVPFDFVDTGPGGAAHQMWERLRGMQDVLDKL